MERIGFEEIITGLAAYPPDEQTWALMDVTRPRRDIRRIIKASRELSITNNVMVAADVDTPDPLCWNWLQRRTHRFLGLQVTGASRDVQSYLRLLDHVVNYGH